MRSPAVVVPLLCLACAAPAPPPSSDWLVDGTDEPARVVVSADGRTLQLENGLLRRTFRLEPDGATVALDDLMTGASLLRAVGPEARLELDGRALAVGGLLGQPDRAYLRPSWLEQLRADPEALHLARWREGPTEAPFAWARVRHAEDRPWPPPGRRLTLSFAADDAHALAGLQVDVVHELYDGMPLLGKWIVVRNGTGRDVVLDHFRSEELALVEAESHVDPSPEQRKPDLTVRSDHSFGGMSTGALERVVRWLPDPEYLTQVNYARTAPLLLAIEPERGPGLTLAPEQELAGFRSFLLVHDSTERERKGLAERRMWRALAPWTTENPLMMHVRSADPDAVKLAIEQCVEVGFEMVILTFGSGFDIEDERPETHAKWKELADYAHARGIELGGYSLLASRRISDEHDVIDPVTGETGHARFGNSPCLGSAWGQDYFRKLYAFYEATGFDLLEHDGNYPGDVCASNSHPGHAGLDDSVWTQWRTITDFYRWSRERGLYLNVPDSYMLAGSNKTGMGYRETNWSLPRDEQVLHGRQNVFDGTWSKPPSMGWMFVPLTEYHGGGAAATLEPLSEHLDAYEAHLANNLAAGVQACWRGPRLYDSDETRQLVTRWVSWFKRHRPILESDVLHLRRADGRDLDMLLHVNPELDERALLAVWNPTDGDLTRELRVPLHYAGVDGSVRARRSTPEGLGPWQRLSLSDQREAALTVSVPARGFAAWVLEQD
jgi:hypothetical protein